MLLFRILISTIHEEGRIIPCIRAQYHVYLSPKCFREHVLWNLGDWWYSVPLKKNWWVWHTIHTTLCLWVCPAFKERRSRKIGYQRSLLAVSMVSWNQKHTKYTWTMEILNVNDRYTGKWETLSISLQQNWASSVYVLKPSKRETYGGLLLSIQF